MIIIRCARSRGISRAKQALLAGLRESRHEAWPPSRPSCGAGGAGVSRDGLRAEDH